MSIWFSSDLHFNHSRLFIYGPRGFDNVEDMNETIIRNFNSKVQPEDDLWILGDLCLGGGSNEALAANKALIERLPGRIHIVRGNHCTDARIEMYKSCKNVVEVCDAKFLKYGKYHFYLSHYSTMTSNQDYDKPLQARCINLCGHQHTSNPFNDWNKGFINYHVEVDAHGCRPVLLDDIIQEMKEKVNKSFNQL